MKTVEGHVLDGCRAWTRELVATGIVEARREVNRMDDLISRQAAIDTVKKLIWLTRDAKDVIAEVIEELPSAYERDKAEAQPQRVRGRWKRTYLDHEAMGERPSVFYCSECSQCIAYPTNYCPYCGSYNGGSQDG